jgi:hypothetical protein
MGKKTVSIKLRQPLQNQHLMEYIQSLFKSERTLYVGNLDSSGSEVTKLIFTRSRAIKHRCVFDYKSTDAVTHSIKIKYQDLDSYALPNEKDL